MARPKLMHRLAATLLRCLRAQPGQAGLTKVLGAGRVAPRVGPAGVRRVRAAVVSQRCSAGKGRGGKGSAGALCRRGSKGRVCVCAARLGVGVCVCVCVWVGVCRFVHSGGLSWEPHQTVQLLEVAIDFQV